MLRANLPWVGDPVSRCVLGTSGLRTTRAAYPILDAYVAAGGNCLDTAHAYGGGTAERTCGGWLADRGMRDGMVLLAKGAHPPHCRPETVTRQLDETLERIGTGFVDLYLLHRDNPAVPVGEFVDALEAEASAGRVGAYGVSNWRLDRVHAANAYAASKCYNGIVALSNHFSLASPVADLYPGCVSVSCLDRAYLAAHDVALFPWSSQARGFFSDVPPDRLDSNMVRCWDSEQNRSRRERTRVLAERYGVAPINIALAYVLAQPFLTFPIVGPQSVDELRIAVRGSRIELAPCEVEWLEHGRSPMALSTAVAP